MNYSLNKSNQEKSYKTQLNNMIALCVNAKLKCLMNKYFSMKRKKLIWRLYAPIPKRRNAFNTSKNDKEDNNKS